MKRFLLLFFGLVLSGCGGGGGGSSNSGPVAPPPTPTPPPQVSGDFLNLAQSRGWNYQSTNSVAGPVTLSLYVDAMQAANQDVLVATLQAGLVPTVLTSQVSAEHAVIGGLSFATIGNSYTVSAQVSVGSSSLVPGTPLLIASPLIQGTVTTPYPGVTETVVSVGTVPGANACPTPATGAIVTYAYVGQTYTVAYVPGCGITQLTLPSGVVFTLISMGQYSAIGNLSIARRFDAITPFSIIRSALGLERSQFPAAKLFR